LIAVGFHRPPHALVFIHDVIIAHQRLDFREIGAANQNYRRVAQILGDVIAKPDLVGVVPQVPPEGIQRVIVVGDRDGLIPVQPFGNRLHLFQHVFHVAGGVRVDQVLLRIVIVDVSGTVRGAEGENSHDSKAGKQQGFKEGARMPIFK